MVNHHHVVLHINMTKNQDLSDLAACDADTNTTMAPFCIKIYARRAAEWHSMRLKMKNKRDKWRLEFRPIGRF